MIQIFFLRTKISEIRVINNDYSFFVFPNILITGFFKELKFLSKEIFILYLLKLGCKIHQNIKLSSHF